MLVCVSSIGVVVAGCPALCEGCSSVKEEEEEEEEEEERERERERERIINK